MKASVQLRKMFGTYDPFNIKRIRRRSRPIPEWATDNSRIRTILLHSFPRLASNALQRKRAARWARVIYLYFQTGHSYAEVADELQEKPRTVEMIIRAIHRASRGGRANGKKGAVNHANMGGANKDPQGTPQPTNVERCTDLSPSSTLSSSGNHDDSQECQSSHLLLD